MDRLPYVGVVALLTLACSAIAFPPPPVLDRIEVQGTPRTGVVAVGGETTGIIIVTKKGTYELSIRDRKLLARTEALNGKTVKVTGNLVVQKGVEIAERKIIHVATD